MPQGESIETVAIGSKWVACQTDANFLRFFTKDGVQKIILSQSSMVVTMAGYENLLAIVYHSGLPIYEFQQLKCKIIDTNNFKTIYDGQCPVSKSSNISWFGFSDEGHLTSFDDNGIISAFNFKNEQWSPILDLKVKFPRAYKNIWIVGFMENQLMYIEMT